MFVLRHGDIDFFVVTLVPVLIERLVQGRQLWNLACFTVAANVALMLHRDAHLLVVGRFERDVGRTHSPIPTTLRGTTRGYYGLSIITNNRTNLQQTTERNYHKQPNKYTTNNRKSIKIFV